MPHRSTVIVRYFAGARAAAGVTEERVALDGTVTLGRLVTELGDRHGEALSRVLTASSVLVDEVGERDRDARIRDGATVDVLPPFAGG